MLIIRPDEALKRRRKIIGPAKRKYTNAANID